jgi:predicted SAM-dependent methyltransferase
MWDLPFEDNSIEEIYSSHALEHVAISKVPETLREWFRVLKPGGKAIIQVPDFNYVAKYWLTGMDRTWAEEMIFGNQAHEGEFHKCAFTHELLKGDLEAAGFEVRRVEMRWSHNQDTLQAVCCKKV